MSETSEREALEESERETLEGSAVFGAPVADATTHDASHTAADSTDAEIEAGLKGSGV
jgi:hypothetical protein